MIDDGKGNIWIGTDNTGITIYNINSNECTEIMYEKNNRFSIPTNHIDCFYHDRQNIMWVGTSKRGVAYTCLDNTFFERQNTAGQDDVSCILEDRVGNIWLGSDGDGITRIDAVTGRLTQYNHQNGTIAESLIVCSYLDSKDRIWFGTYGGGVFYYEKGKFTSLHYDNANGLKDPLQDIRSITEDMAGNIWVGTVVKGLYCYETDGTFTNYTVDDVPIGSNSIVSWTLIPARFLGFLKKRMVDKDCQIPLSAVYIGTVVACCGLEVEKVFQFIMKRKILLLI